MTGKRPPPRMPQLMEAGMVINRIAALAVIALAWPALPLLLPARAQPVDKAEMQAVIARADEELTQRYIYPDRAAAGAAKIKAALAAGDYDAITDPKSFAERLTADLRSVTHDKHMSVFLAAEMERPAPPQTDNKNGN